MPLKRILCPVDVLDCSQEAVDVATTMAKDRGAMIDFIYVTPLWFPAGSNLKVPFVRSLVEEHQSRLYQIKPTDASVPFEHHYVEGNAGPTIVESSENADLIVMGTHGRGGIAKLLMGSVANYVSTHAKCSVLLVKANEGASVQQVSEDAEGKDEFAVAKFMRSDDCIFAYDEMEPVLERLTRAGATAASVVDESGKCIGILTTSDIGNYLELKKRFQEKDESVLDEVLETDRFGQRRTCGTPFDRVERHMSTDVVAIGSNGSIKQAFEMFAANPSIHHLVVIDSDDRPVGIVDQADVAAKMSASEVFAESS